MKIYISHSKSFDFKNELYEPLKQSSLFAEHEFILPHDESDTPFDTKQLFVSGTCNLVIAEVSYPATGQGIELGWADMFHIPIICIYKQDAKISGSLSVVSQKFLMYTSKENMIEDITKALELLDKLE